ncbi:MAG: RtcB family protein [Polyangiaceae bacterium]
MHDLFDMSFDEESRVDIHHNFVAKERHLDRDLWVHRKGAVRAAAGEKSMIPGSMGTASYLVEGQGEALSFCSCSHGAGRVIVAPKPARASDQRHSNVRCAGLPTIAE